MIPRNTRSSLFILLFTNLLDWVSIGLVYPMFSSMIFQEGAHFFSLETSDVVKGTWLGILLAAGPLAQFFSSPLIGTFSDQRGRKPLLKSTLLLIMGGYALSAFGVFVQSLTLLLIGRLIVGLGTGNVAVILASIADISRAEEKAKNFGLVSMASGIGFAIGPFIGGTLSSWGFAVPFLFSIASSGINLLLILFWFKETHTLRKKKEFSLLLGLKNFKKAFQFPALRSLFLSFFFFCVAWSFYWEFIPVTWIQQYHLSPSQISHFYAYGALFYALSSGLLIRPIVSRFQPFPILFVSLLILPCTIIPLLLHSTVDVFWIYVPVQQFLIALVFPTGATLVSNSVSEDVQGEFLGILQSVDSFAFASSPLIAGFLVGLNAEAPMIVSGICLLLAALILWMSYGKKLFKGF